MKNFKGENNPNYRGGNEYACEICGKLHYRTPIRTTNAKHFYCSDVCRNKGASKFPNNILKGEYKICPICKNKFYVCRGSLDYRKYCSYECRNKSQENHTILTCIICGKEYRTYNSHIKWRGSKYCSKICMRIGASLRTGDKSPSWKGGISFLKNKVRKTIEWKEWRNLVYERDNYTCQICGARSNKGISIILHPHHIKSYSKYPDIRFDVNNGITLCSACHYKLHGNLNLGRKIENIRYSQKLERECLFCSIKFFAKTRKHIYCSHNCEMKYKRRIANYGTSYKELS